MGLELKLIDQRTPDMRINEQLELEDAILDYLVGNNDTEKAYKLAKEWFRFDYMVDINETHTDSGWKIEQHLWEWIDRGRFEVHFRGSNKEIDNLANSVIFRLSNKYGFFKDCDSEDDIPTKKNIDRIKEGIEEQNGQQSDKRKKAINLTLDLIQRSLLGYTESTKSPQLKERLLKFGLGMVFSSLDSIFSDRYNSKFNLELASKYAVRLGRKDIAIYCLSRALSYNHLLKGDSIDGCYGLPMVLGRFPFLPRHDPVFTCSHYGDLSGDMPDYELYSAGDLFEILAGMRTAFHANCYSDDIPKRKKDLSDVNPGTLVSMFKNRSGDGKTVLSILYQNGNYDEFFDLFSQFRIEGHHMIIKQPGYSWHLYVGDRIEEVATAIGKTDELQEILKVEQ